MKRNGFALAGIVLALGAVSQTANTGGAASNATSAGEGAPNTLLPKVQEPLKELLCGYFKPSHPSTRGDWSCLPPNVELTTLLMTVPDPESTHLALYTDRFIESATSAATNSTYYLSRYYLPWKTKPEKEIPRFLDRELQRVQSERRRKEAGLLLFRGNSATKVLLIFVVPEEPTSGVNLDVLERTLGQLKRRPGFQQTAELQIVGPTFSGSIVPLGRYLHTAGQPARLMSGSATDTAAYADFKKLDPILHLSSTIEGDRRAFNLFHAYLDDLAGFLPVGQIALLGEDETSYGAQLPSDDDDHLFKLPYPRNIARLRNIFQDGPLLPDTGKGEQPPQDPNRLNLRDSFDADNEFVAPDSPPAFSARLSPASDQGSLLTLASELNRRQARYVGVTATDVLDVVFVTSFLKRAQADLRLFTLDSDILFLRESETTSLTGLLSVSTYPLLGRGVPFESRYSEGVYNAVGWFLGKSPTDYSRPFDPRGKERPPLWLTVLGRDGNYPIALLDQQARNPPCDSTLLDTPSAGPDGSFGSEPPSRGWLLVFAFVTLFGFAHTWRCGQILDPKASSADRPEFRKHLQKALAGVFNVYPDDRAPTVPERIYLTAISLASLVALFVMTSSAMRFFETWYPAAGHNWPLAASAAGAIAGPYILVRAVRLSMVTLGSAGHYKRVLFPTWLLAVVVIGAWSHLILNDRFQAGYFLAHRSLYLTNGVTPAVPLLLTAAGLVVWAWMQLRREGMMEMRKEAYLCRQAPGEFRECFDRIDESIKDVFSTRIWMPAFFFLAIWLALQMPLATGRSLEGLWYDSGFWLSTIMLDWVIALCWMQFIRIWANLQRFLQALERHPIRDAFSRLEKQVEWVPLVTKPYEHAVLITSRCMDTLRALGNLQDATHGAFISDVALTLNAEWGLNVLFADIEKTLRESSPALYRPLYNELQRRLDQLQEAAEQELSNHDWNRGGSDSLNGEMTKTRSDNEPLSSTDRARILMEEFIALRHMMYMRYVFRHLRNLLGFIIGGFILAVVAVNVYPFQGERWLAFTAVAAFLVLGIGVSVVFAKMDRDKIMSRITSTTPGKLGGTFFLRLAEFGALPLVAVLAAQFPSLNRIFSSVLQPALEALR
jgi:hypothetical protein